MKSMTVLVDTREHDGKNQHILKYFDSKDIPWRKTKLDYGDYTFEIPKNEALNIPRTLSFASDIIVERKASLNELTDNLIKDRARLQKEFTLAPKTKVLLIENNGFADLVNGRYISKYDPKAFTATLFTFWHEYNLPVFFVPKPDYSGLFIYYYFQYYFRGLLKS